MCNPIALCKRSSFPALWVSAATVGLLPPSLSLSLLSHEHLVDLGVPEPPWQGLVAERRCWLVFLTGAHTPSTHSVQSAWGERRGEGKAIGHHSWGLGAFRKC